MIGLSLLDDYDALCDAERAQIAVPAFDGVFLGEAMTSEQLNAVEADLHALVGGNSLGQCGLSRKGQALFGARCAAPRHVISRSPSSSIAMLAHMNATDCLRAMGSPNASRSLT